MRFEFKSSYARYNDEDVFNGTQLDDFLAGLASHPDSALVLGSGPGAICFSLRRAQPEIRVDGIDIDSREIALAKALCDYLGIDNIRFRSQDALGYVREYRDEPYDLILIDMYTDASWLNFHPAFWAEVRRVSSSNGVVLINVWGLPEYLDPVCEGSPTAAVIAAAAVGGGFDSFIYLSHMRNTTLIFGTEEDLRSMTLGFTSLEATSSVDQFASLALRMKLKVSPVLSTRGYGVDERSWTFDRVQHLFESRLTDEFGSRSAGLSARAWISNLLDDESKTIEFLEEAMERRETQICCLVSTFFHVEALGSQKSRLKWFP